MWGSRLPLYRELLEMTCRLGNLLRRRGVKRGDCVTIYMPPCPVAVASMLACARIGAAHNVVFAGFSAEALSERIRDGETQSRCATLANTDPGKTRFDLQIAEIQWWLYYLFNRLTWTLEALSQNSASVCVIFSPVQHCDHGEPGRQRGEGGGAEEDCG